MKRLYIIIIYVFVIIFYSCDYVTVYTYTITNTTDISITLKAKENVGYKPYIIERSYVIFPHSSQQIHEFSVVDGRNESPSDIHSINNIIPVSFDEINIYTDSFTISSKLMQRGNWRYTTKTQTGMYELEITEELLENFIDINNLQIQ